MCLRYSDMAGYRLFAETKVIIKQKSIYKMKRFFAVLLAFVCMLPLVGCASTVEKADRVIYGNIYTSNDEAKTAEALAIKGDKFIYVGSKSGVKKYIGS